MSKPRTNDSLKLSTIIATHNRPNLCIKNVQSILDNCKNTQCEIIIVDSNSTAQNQNILKNFVVNKPIKYVSSKKVGLSVARNTGWQAASGEYVAYIDDDAIAGKNWIKNILRFIEMHPNIQAFGGPHDRHAVVPIPNWMPINYGKKMATKGIRKIVIGQEFLNGTNMIFKKSLLKKIGGFNKKYGMVGNKMFYGEETELQLRLARLGVDVWWDDNIKVSHLIHERKMHLSWIIKEAFLTGRATQKMMTEFRDVFAKAKSSKQKSSNTRVEGSFIQKCAKLIQLLSYAMGRCYQMAVI